MNKLMSFLAILALCFAMLTGVAHAQTQRVTTLEALEKALRSADAGSVIELAPGTYNVLSLRRYGVGGRVTLRSADVQKPARFSGMKLREVKGLTLENVVFKYDFQPGDKTSLRPFQILNSSEITIRGALFEGDLSKEGGVTQNGFPTAFALGVRDSSQITLQNNAVHTFFRGFVFSKTSDIVVEGNDIHTIRVDGMNFAEVQNVRIQANHIHNFARSVKSKDHADMIQFWTRNTKKPSSNIIIRDNILNSGSGAYTQSIFMRNDQVDRGLAGSEMFYQDVTIENNLIINAHLHGITVGESKDLKIRNNTVVRNVRSQGNGGSDSLWTPQIRVAEAGRNVEISHNVTHRIHGVASQSDWSVDANYFVQDQARMQPGFYGQVFGVKVLRDPTRVSSFVPKPGGPIDGIDVGVQNLPLQSLER